MHYLTHYSSLYEMLIDPYLYHLHLLNWNTQDLECLKDLVESNQLKPLGCEKHYFNEEGVNSAFEKLISRRTVGKIAPDRCNICRVDILSQIAAVCAAAYDHKPDKKGK